MASEQLKAIVDMLRARPMTEGASVEEMRKGMEAMTTLTPLPEGTVCAAVSADGVPCEWTTAPGADESRAILYLHGGGYVIGSIATHRSLVARLSGASGARALSVDYRLAPEHPFPAAVDDATTAYRWLLSQGLDPARVVVAGDSAGGGLTVATLLALRDAGDPLPAAAVCLSPWADLEMSGASASNPETNDPLLPLDGLIGMAGLYAGEDHLRNPLAAPLHGDYSGLPPLLIQVGTRELLLDDARRVADRARAAGVDVTLEVEEGLIHVWQLFGPDVPESREAVERIGAFVQTHVP
jgi:acetyl esterase/lipase